MPADFAAFALAHRVKVTRAHFHISSETFERWAVEAGIMSEIHNRTTHMKKVLPIPADFADHASRETNVQLRERYRTDAKVVRRWARQLGITVPVIRPKMKPPENFAAAVANLFKYEAAQRFQVGENTISRWAADTGATFRKMKAIPVGPRQSLPPQADASLAGQAAQHLRRLMPVFKATVIDRKRDGYVVGGRQMATEEMITMAKAKGFDPDAWRTI